MAVERTLFFPLSFNEKQVELTVKLSVKDDGAARLTVSHPDTLSEGDKGVAVSYSRSSAEQDQHGMYLTDEFLGSSGVLRRA
jgi:hypothetical protein